MRPPVVISTSPESFAILEELRAPIRFVFDERISERVGGGSLEDAVSISPRAGEIVVQHGRRELTIDVLDGLRPGIVYRVTLQPVVSDMFGNQLTDAFELVFTTGGDPVATTLAGEVWERTSGRPVAEAAVHAVGSDSLVHESTAGRDGIYAFRYLPEGEFSIVAFEDRNRDGEVDSTEVQGIATAALGPGDTLFLDVPVLPPDTLPAVLSSADALDSITVELRFDDFLEPEQPVAGMVVGLERVGGSAPGVARLFHAADYLSHVRVVTDSLARLDSLDRAEAAGAVAEDPVAPAPVGDTAQAPDTAAVAAPAGAPVGDTAAVATPDTTGVADTTAATDTLAAPAPGFPPAAVVDPQAIEAPPARPTPVALAPLAGSTPGPVEGTERVLPGRRLVAVLEAPLEADVEYTVRVASVVNVNGLGGGGGEVELLLASAPPDTAVVDTLALPDTGTALPDTGALARSSLLHLFPRR